MLRLAAIAALAIALGAAGSASATSFRTPSGLIYCSYQTGPKFLRCDTWYRTRFSGHKHCAMGDYGQAFGMRPHRRARVLCVSDSTFSEHAKVLRYGHKRRFGPFRCWSERTGLTCLNRGGHGWGLSRAAQSVF